MNIFWPWESTKGKGKLIFPTYPMIEVFSKTINFFEGKCSYDFKGLLINYLNLKFEFFTIFNKRYMRRESFAPG